jgi:hypothetical protein
MKLIIASTMLVLAYALPAPPTDYLLKALHKAKDQVKASAANGCDAVLQFPSKALHKAKDKVKASAANGCDAVLQFPYKDTAKDSAKNGWFSVKKTAFSVSYHISLYF